MSGVWGVCERPKYERDDYDLCVFVLVCMPVCVCACMCMRVCVCLCVGKILDVLNLVIIQAQF